MSKIKEIILDLVQERNYIYSWEDLEIIKHETFEAWMIELMMKHYAEIYAINCLNKHTNLNISINDSSCSLSFYSKELKKTFKLPEHV